MAQSRLDYPISDHEQINNSSHLTDFFWIKWKLSTLVFKKDYTNLDEIKQKKKKKKRPKSFESTSHTKLQDRTTSSFISCFTSAFYISISFYNISELHSTLFEKIFLSQIFHFSRIDHNPPSPTSHWPMVTIEYHQASLSNFKCLIWRYMIE